LGCKIPTEFVRSRSNLLYLLKEENKLQDQPWYISFIPDEIFIHIFSFLSAKDVCALAQTCHRFHNITEDEIIWINIVKNDPVTATKNHKIIIPGKSVKLTYIEFINNVCFLCGIVGRQTIVSEIRVLYGFI